MIFASKSPKVIDAESLQDPSRRNWIALGSAFVFVACKNTVLRSGTDAVSLAPVAEPKGPQSQATKNSAPTQKKIASNSVSQDLIGLTVTLDVGHAYKGTDGPAVDKANDLNEHVQVRSQATTISEKLTGRGAQVNIKIYETFNTTELGSRGRAGAGSSAFVSLHHNALNNRDVQGSLVLVDSRRGKLSADKLLAGRIQDKMVAALWPDGSSFSGPKFNQGIRDQKLGVLKSVPASVTACCLTEPYFITGKGAADEGKKWTTLSGEAIAEGIAVWHLERSSPTAYLTGVFDEYELTPSEEIDAKLYENH